MNNLYKRFFAKIRRLNLSTPWAIPHNPTTTPEDIFYCFRLLLGRSPNEVEWFGHSLRAGSDLNSVVGSYINSLEFTNRLIAFRSNETDNRLLLKDLSDFSLYVQESDLSVGRGIQFHGEYEPHVTRVFRNFVKPGMHVLDIGANIGYFSMLSASLVGESGRVIAIEPNSNNVKLLEASRRANTFDNVMIMQLAAGREKGLLVLNPSHSNGTTSQLSDDLQSLLESTTVACMKIDELIPEDVNIDFIKIDVEGAEYNALLGASALLKRCKPVIVSEFSPDLMPMISGVEGVKYLELLIEFGYEISVIEHDGKLSEYGKNVDKIMDVYKGCKTDHIDLLFT